MKKGSFLITLLIVFLTGCASSTPDKQYYQLESQPTSRVNRAQAVSKIIFVAPVELAGFIDRNGLVYQTEPRQFVKASQNLWAAPLNNQLQSLVVEGLSSQLPNYLISSAQIARPDYTVKLFIEGFHGRYTGDVIIKGYWVVTDNAENVVKKAFNHQLAQPEDGYSSMVAVLSAGWQREVADFVSAINW